jgi:hypothetical protein
MKMKFHKFDRMKKKFPVVCLLLLAVLTYQSCDYVTNPQPTKSSGGTGGGTTAGSGVVYRKILIEDYTGHKCGNCPAAARELKRLDSIYPAVIVPLAVHAGFYAQTNSQYPTDLRCQASTDYDNTFGNSAAGNPNGLVNRMAYNTPNFIQQWGSWGTSVATFLQDTADWDIKITNTYNSSSNQVTTKVKCTSMKTNADTLNLVVLLAEDSIIGEQIDYSLPSGQQFITNYVFNHVLRGAINTTWGEVILTGASVNKNDSIVKTYSNFQLSSGWKYKHCKVIAFIYNANPNSKHYYEVLQAEEKDVY